MELEFSRLISKNTQISIFMKIRPAGSMLFHANRQTRWSYWSLYATLRTRLKKTYGAKPDVTIFADSLVFGKQLSPARGSTTDSNAGNTNAAKSNIERNSHKAPGFIGASGGIKPKISCYEFKIWTAVCEFWVSQDFYKKKNKFRTAFDLYIYIYIYMPSWTGNTKKKKVHAARMSHDTQQRICHCT